MEWLDIPEGHKHPIESVTESDTFWHGDEGYKRRYAAPFVDRGKDDRYVSEILSEFPDDSSLLVVGAGHSFHCNKFNECSNLSRITALDLYEEAGQGLDSDISFIQGDLMVDEIPTVDYIFSSHTVEHFTRDIIMNVVLPKCIYHARKAVVFVVPYGSIAWADEREHKVRLTENDELAAKAEKYKRLLPEGQELVLWFKGQGRGQQG